MVYKLLSCSPITLSDLVRRLTDRKCVLIAIKQRQRYLRPDLSNVGQRKRLKEIEKRKKANGLTLKLPLTHKTQFSFTTEEECNLTF